MFILAVAVSPRLPVLFSSCIKDAPALCTHYRQRSNLVFTVVLGIRSWETSRTFSLGGRAGYIVLCLPNGALCLRDASDYLLNHRHPQNGRQTFPRGCACLLSFFIVVLPGYLSYYNGYESKMIADVICEYRLRRAREILDRDDEIKIVDVAIEASFSAKSSFNNMFRNFYDMAPSEYRERKPGRGAGIVNS